MSSPEAELGDWLQRHPDLCRQVQIPASVKWEVRDKLDQANVNERVLFPGLDGLSRWLARYYTPTTPPRAKRARGNGGACHRTQETPGGQARLSATGSAGC